MENIIFNIWDDYEIWDDDKGGDTYGYFECDFDCNDDIESSKEVEKACQVIFDYLNTLNLECQIEHSEEQIDFINLTNEYRDKLVEILNNAKLTYKGRLIEVISES